PPPVHRSAGRPDHRGRPRQHRPAGHRGRPARGRRSVPAPRRRAPPRDAVKNRLATASPVRDDGLLQLRASSRRGDARDTSALSGLAVSAAGATARVPPARGRVTPSPERGAETGAAYLARSDLFESHRQRAEVGAMPLLIRGRTTKVVLVVAASVPL